MIGMGTKSDGYIVFGGFEQLSSCVRKRGMATSRWRSVRWVSQARGEVASSWLQHGEYQCERQRKEARTARVEEAEEGWFFAGCMTLRVSYWSARARLGAAVSCRGQED